MTQLSLQQISLVFIVWTVEEKVSDRFHCDTLTFQAGAGFCFADLGQCAPNGVETKVKLGGSLNQK
jgi:hypothetical protein